MNEKAKNLNSSSEKKSLKDYSGEELDNMPLEEVGELFAKALIAGLAATGEAKGKS